ncbi:MAG: hypothetical protein KBD24_01240 [Candidatus Pacebacteria bacterium]|nr:hypothetical protein [Candidatus Paceibacterota bacterium]
MKTIKFAPHLIAQLRDGTKTTTWRLFDDKDLSVGDIVSLVDKESLTEVGTAFVARIVSKSLKEITDEELAEHGYADVDDMYHNLHTYYGDRVTPEAEVKMLTFDQINCPSPH